MDNKKGFTLMELIMTLGIGSIILLVAYTMLTNGYKHYDIGRKKVMINSELNEISHQISEELKNATLVSKSFGENKIGILNETIAVKSNESAEYLNQKINIKEINIEFESKDSGEMINYSITGEFEGIESTIHTAVLLNNIENLSDRESQGIRLSEHFLYYSKNYDVPKNYFMSGIEKEKTIEYQLGIKIAQMMYFYDGYENLGYMSKDSHCLSKKFLTNHGNLISSIKNLEKKLDKEIPNYTKLWNITKEEEKVLIKCTTNPKDTQDENFAQGYNEYASTKESKDKYDQGFETSKLVSEN